MNLSNVRAPKKSSENRKRVGRGMGSGMGKTSTRGHKGQRSRSGSRMMRGFEGGQMPLHRRIPKLKGFSNAGFGTSYQVVNVGRLAALFADGGAVTPEAMVAMGAARKGELIKVLGTGDVSVALRVTAHAFSASAKEKIQAAGGSVTELS